MRPIPVPPWADALEPPAYQRFVGIVKETLDDLGEAHFFDEDAGAVTFDATGAIVDLRSAVTACAAEPDAPRERWHELVQDAIRASVVDPEDVEGILADASRIRASVKVRLYPTDEVDGTTAAVLRRPGPPGTTQVLVLDLAHAVVTVPPDRVDEDAVEELWGLAWERTAASDVPEVDVTEISEGVPVLVLQNPGLFGASTALWLENYFEPTDEGAVVATPTSHVVLVHPIRDTGAMAALGALAGECRRLFDEAPDPLVPTLGWWRPGGMWVELETWTDENGLNLRVPDDFGALLAGLPQGAPGTPPPPDLPS
jgi:hypothetical protein